MGKFSKKGLQNHKSRCCFNHKSKKSPTSMYMTFSRRFVVLFVAENAKTQLDFTHNKLIECQVKSNSVHIFKVSHQLSDSFAVVLMLTKILSKIELESNPKDSEKGKYSDFQKILKSTELRIHSKKMKNGKIFFTISGICKPTEKLFMYRQ